jgi:hypothetical protein
MWFGDRPAHERTNYSDPSTVSVWQANKVIASEGTFVDGNLDRLNLSGGSENNNVPAAMGVPSVTTSIGVTVHGSGTHAFSELAIPGNQVQEAKRMERNLIAALIVAGFNTTDGKIRAPPIADPLGICTAEKQ